MPPRKVSHTPKANPRNKLGEILNPIPREPHPYSGRMNRDLSKCGNEVLPVDQTGGRR